MAKRKTSEIKPSSKKDLIPTGYKKLLEDLKVRIRSSQIKAALRVNQELILLYWEIGKEIYDRQENEKWGSSVIERLAQDLQNEFPGVQGFSRANIFYMRAFYLANQKVQQLVGQIKDLPFFQIPWGHNIILMTKLKDDDQRLWYANKAIELGWSRNMLEIWIENDLFHRQGKGINNFQNTLPKLQSDLATQMMKDPYCFDFLMLGEDAREHEIEQGLIDHIQKFLLELGHGFAFLGRQYSLTVEGDPYYIDMLFYHVKLHCFVVIELKATEFKPEYAGQLNFYLSAVDDLLKQETDNPTIGILLCKTKNSVKVEYAFRNINRPISVSGYETMLTESLPKNLKGSLPTVEEFEAELLKDIDIHE